MKKYIDLDEMYKGWRSIPKDEDLIIGLIDYGIIKELGRCYEKIYESVDISHLDKCSLEFNKRLTELCLYEKPIMVSHQNPRNEEEKEAGLRYKDELKSLYGEYHSLRELLKSDNLEPLSKKMEEENWRRINEGGIYTPQRGLIIDPCGIVYRYGVMCRGQGVPMQGNSFKLAKVRYITARFLS